MPDDDDLPPLEFDFNGQLQDFVWAGGGGATIRPIWVRLKVQYDQGEGYYDYYTAIQRVRYGQNNDHIFGRPTYELFNYQDDDEPEFKSKLVIRHLGHIVPMFLTLRVYHLLDSVETELDNRTLLVGPGKDTDYSIELSGSGAGDGLVIAYVNHVILPA